ncbi:MAG TPA: glycoside hydrolase family 3 C-terminal domain-containing protein [Actinocrinis sp.]|uniref:glycoside hydrolase family 3 C-terminal domain-containing protein n=1 Tax=Actinocrinis sp. TaxID=1920516 RepID=UPI002DDD93DA|nr:glycoside hydrolase family 3 C-terminal domain-containing protein [Actinocrinis sp.]HEV3173339.1 glycoside hydrolase family 3 C-terminal domain-containing protein [Actinocrinis sp.]
MQALIAAAVTGVTAAAAPAATASSAGRANPLPIYLDTHYSFQARAADLVSRMTLPEKVAQLSTNSAPAIPRLGVQQYTYWSEGQHGVNTLGANQDNGGNGGPPKATSFPTNFASTMTWDPSLVYQETTAISDEVRGFLDKSLFGTGQNNLGPSASDYGSLTFWAPTVNLDRDPLWGRTDEAFGEDPYLVGQMAGAFVDGYEGNTLSGQSRTGYLKVASTAKHYALNNTEDNRTGISSNVSDTDLRDYYTKQFASLIENAHVSGLMTSYNAINGTPSVADTYTANQIAQRTYGFGGYVTSDCGAIGTTYQNFPSGHDWAPPGYTTDSKGANGTWTNTATGTTVPAAAGGQAYALRAGTDLNCAGGENTFANIEAAISAGVLSEGVIDNALIKLFTVRMETGEFDPPSQVPYTSITKSAIQSPAHQSLATTVADDSLVLLKNDNLSGTSAPLLPLNAAATNKIVIVGDLANTVTLGGYSGDPALQVSAVQGITSAVQAANPGAQVVFDACGTSTTNTAAASCSSATMSDIGSADAVIVFVGTDENVASEGKDRTSLNMPGNYDSLINQVAAVGNPRMALAIQSDGPVKISDVQSDFPAIVFSGYNGESQGTALADVLFGKHNPDGHLDFTWYADDSQLAPMSNYGLTPAETGGLGRTYQFFTGTPTYPFGYGLSYSNFSYSDVKVDHSSVNANGAVHVGVVVTNTGTTAGSTVAQLYAAPSFTVSGVTFPQEQLAGFQKTKVLRPGESQYISMVVHLPDLSIWDSNAMKSVVYDGTYAFKVGASSADIRGTADVDVTGALSPDVQTVTVQPDQVDFQVGQTLDLTGKNPWIADDTTGVGSVPQGRNMSVTADNIIEAANNDGSFVDLSKAHVSYLSSDPSVATVDQNGLVTAVGTGTATITVTVDGVSGSMPIVVGHAVSVSAPALAQPGQNATVTTTFTNTAPAASGISGTVQNVAMNLDLPSGWSATAKTPSSFASVAAGQKVTTTWSVSVPTGGAGNFTLDADATINGVHDSTGYTQLAVPFSSLTAAFNNSAVSTDANRCCADLDGAGASYSAEALASVGVTPGAPFVHDGLTFTWPNAGPGQPDNVVAAGQTVDISGSGSTLGFLGTSAWGPDTGTGTIAYTDGSTQQFTLGFGDWANGTPPTGGDVAIRSPYGNQPGNKTGWQATIDYFPVTIDSTKTVQSVTLPQGDPQPQPGTPPMHIFGMSIKSDNLSITAPPAIEPGGSATVTTALTNPSSSALSNVALSLNLPGGWSAANTTPNTFAAVAAGATVSTTWSVTVPSGQQPGPQVIAATESVGGTQVGISGAQTEVPYSSLTTGFNNVSITDDSNHGPGNIDGGGNSFSAQALAAVGLSPGALFTVNGLTFTWPSSAAGTNDNVEADGRAISITGSGTTLGFLGAAANGQSSGTATITYTDGTTQQFTLGFGDWAGTTPYPGSQVAVTSAYGNTSSGTSPWKASVFYDAVTLQTGKTVQSVTLPSAGSSPLHVFAATIG